MGIDIDDIEFHLRWNWNSRSSQWGWTRWLTVSDYYSMFCHWKDDMESHGCPAEEGDYIDAFLENLRQELRSKVIHHRSQMSSLADALFYAKGEEMMMNIDDKLEAFRLNRARFSHEFEASEVFDKIPRRDAQKEFSSVTPPKVFDNLPDRIRVSPKELPPTDSQSVPEKCYSFSAIEEVELSSLKAGIQLMERPAELFPSRLDVPKVAYQVFEEMPEPVPTIQHSSSKGCLFPNMADEQLVDEVRQPPLLKMNCLKAGRHLFDEIPERFSVQRNTDKNVVLPTSGLLKILSYEEAASEFQSVKLEGSKSPEHVFDKMLQQFSVKLKNKINGYEKWKPSMVDFPGDLDSKADKMKVGSTNSSSKMMFGEMGVFMFDPGISSWLRKGCGFTKSNGVKHNFDKMPSNLNVELWVGKVLVFVFDPGGSSLFPTRCNSFLLTDYEHHFEIFSGIKAGFVLPFAGNGKIILSNLGSVCLSSKWENSAANFSHSMLNPIVLGYTVIIRAYASTTQCFPIHYQPLMLYKHMLIQCSKGNNVTFTFFIKECVKQGCLYIGRSIHGHVLKMGLCAIFVYILEDKDIFKRVGKRMISMDTTLVKWDMKMSYYVDGCLVSNSFYNKAPMEYYETIGNRGVTGWSSVVPHAAFCSNILRNGGNEELCNETIDETIENSVKLFFYIYDKQGNDQFMSKTKWMVIQFGMVCCVTYSSTNCRSMSEYMKLLCTRESPMGGIGYDCIQHLIDRSAGSIDIICRGWMGYVFAILFAPLALSWLLMRLISSGVKSRDTRHLSSRIVQRLQPGLLTCWKLLEGNQRQSYMNLALIIVGEFQELHLSLLQKYMIILSFLLQGNVFSGGQKYLQKVLGS